MLPGMMLHINIYIHTISCVHCTIQFQCVACSVCWHHASLGVESSVLDPPSPVPPGVVRSSRLDYM